MSTRSGICTVLADGIIAGAEAESLRVAEEEEEEDEEDDDDEEEDEAEAEGGDETVDGPVIWFVSLQLPDIILRSLENIPHSLTNAWSSGRYLVNIND